MPRSLPCFVGAAVMLLGPLTGARAQVDQAPAPAAPLAAPPMPDLAPLPADPATPAPPSSWQVNLNGYLHVAYRWIQQPQNYNLAGRNNGFQLEQARLVASVAWRRWLSLRISVEGASEDRLGQSFPGGQITARLRDGFLTFSPLRALRVSVGQMVTPWDLDSMRSDAALPFVSRSVAAEGVQPTEGFTTRGMGADRSLGVSLHSGFIELMRALTLRYSVLVGNSNGQNQIRSDNNLPAVFGRVELTYWGSRGLPTDLPVPMYAISDPLHRPLVSLGVAGQWVPRTVGNLPDLIRETDAGAAADIVANFLGLDLQAGLIYLRTSHDTLTAVPDVERLGLWAHARYIIPRIPPEVIVGYRIASYAPRAHLGTDAGSPADARVDSSLNLLYHTLGVSVRPLRGFPLRANLGYTFTTEQSPNDLSNDRFEADIIAAF